MNDLVNTNPEGDLVFRAITICQRLSPQSRLQATKILTEIHEMAKSDRRRLYDYGRLMCKLLTLADMESETVHKDLQDLFVEQLRWHHAAIRAYDRFDDFQHLLPMISCGVQRWLLEHRLNEQLLAEVITLAEQGKEVTTKLFDEQVLPRYDQPTLPAPSANGHNEEEVEVRKPPSDPPAKPAPKPSPQPAPQPAAAQAAPEVEVLTEEEWHQEVNKKKGGLDASEFRNIICRNGQTEIGNVIRSVDDLAREYKLPRGPWHHKILSGGNEILAGLKELKVMDIRR